MEKDLEQENDNIQNHDKKIDVGKIEKKIERLNDLYIDGRINKDKYEKEYNNYQSLINEGKKKHKKADLSHIKKLLDKDVRSHYNSLNNVEKRAFWGTFIDRIEIDKEHFDIFFKLFDN